MIPKISRRVDGNMTGLMRYLVGPGRSNEHENPRIVAGSPALMAWYSDMELTVPDAERIAEHLEHPQKVYGTQVYGGNTWHCSLSIRAEEGVLPDERWAQIGQRFMEHMGFLDGAKAPVRWAFVRHGLSSGRDGQPGNDHGHLAVELVREDGTKASTWNDRPRAQAACAALEREFGLQVVEGRAVGRVTRGVSRAELERQTRMRAAEPERRALARVVRAVAAQSGTEAEFVAGLRTAGVRAEPWFAKGRTDIVEGYKVAGRPEPGKAVFWLGGNNLSPDLSLPRLRRSQGWPDTPGDAAAAVTAWRGLHPATRRAPSVVPEAVWRQRAGEVAALRAWLDGLPPADPRWISGAGELAGVFAAWAGSVEAGRPGPLSRAADRLGHIASVRAYAAPPRPPGMPSGRGAARVVASVARGGRGSVAQLALLAQLRDAAVAVAGAGQAQRLAAQAAQAAEEARAQFAAAQRPTAGRGPVGGRSAVQGRVQGQQQGQRREGWGRDG